MRGCFVCIATLVVGWAGTFAQLPPIPEKPGVDAKRQPRLFVAKPVQDLGSLLEGDKAPVTWRLENRGNADLIVEKTKASCGCTVVRLLDEEKTIPPGGSLDLQAEYDSHRRRGPQRTSVMVYTNDPLDPMLKLELTANVMELFTLTPSKVLNVRSLKRGDTAKQTLDLTPTEGHDAVELLSVELGSTAQLTYAVEPLDRPTGSGRRILFTVSDNAPLGPVSTRLTIRVKVGEIERAREIRIRGEVVGDLTCQPKIVADIRHKSKRGKRLAPVAVKATNKTPFDILSVSAGGLLDTTFEEVERAKDRTHYNVYMTIRDDAPSGPFGAMLEVRTSSLDQPMIRVPVFAIVVEPIEVDPPVILLRQDGTPAGTERRIRIKAATHDTLQITDVACENNAVAWKISTRGGSALPHICYVDVTLVGTLPEGTHETILTMRTGISGAQQLAIPVTIVVPTRGR